MKTRPLLLWLAVWAAAASLLGACQAPQTALPEPSVFPTRTAVISMPSAAASVLPTAARTSPAPPTPTLLPATLPPSPTAELQKAEVAAGVLDVWDDPAHENGYWHRQTQLITAERVVILTRRGEWAQIYAVEQPSAKHPLGYPGWVRADSLAPGWSSADLWAVVMVPLSLLRQQPGPGSVLLARLFLDTRLPVLDQQEGWALVRLPGGQSGWLPKMEIRLAASREERASLQGFDALALSFIGTPYLWGGTSSDVLDCSGFTYRLFHAHGINLGRDSGDQLAHGTAVDFDLNQPVSSAALKRGDLLFFTVETGGPVIHVGIAWGNGLILDTNTGRGLVLHSLAEMKAEGIFHSARRVADFP